MLGSLTIYLKGMRRMMFQLSGFYCICVVVTDNYSESADTRQIKAVI